jgi:hypothetical protein
MRRGKNQSITKAKIPEAIVRLAAVDAVAAAGPELNFVTAFDRAGLGASGRRTKNQEKDGKNLD